MPLSLPFCLPVLLATVLCALPFLAAPALAHGQDVRERAQHMAPPRIWHGRPPTSAQVRFMLPDSKTIVGRPLRQPVRSFVTSTCQDLTAMARYRGPALADYLQQLPAAECTYGLFSLAPEQASVLYAQDNLDAVVERFRRQSLRYAAQDAELLNLTLYLRAGYFLAENRVLPPLAPAVATGLRAAIRHLLDGTALFDANAHASTTAQEIGLLIINMHDEASHLAAAGRVFARYTNSETQPRAAEAARETSAARGLSGLLNVFYFAHFRATPNLQTDPTLTRTLYAFVEANRRALSGTESAFLLRDAARESLRFMQYPALKPIASAEAKNLLKSSSMTGADNDLWLAAAEAVKYYDADNCAQYGTCGFERRLVDAVLGQHYTCGAIRLRTQEMTYAQFHASCGLMQAEEADFHARLATGKRPVADDYNRSLEVVVFDDYDNYSKYAPVIYGSSTDNGGIYLEGNPADPDNQARFLAHEASWLRPAFSIWNLGHEYVHYLDGRFNMYGDFALSTSEPTIWWLEGVAEYVAKGRDNPGAVEAARNGQYPLSTIFGNTYGMQDYVNRAYNWGYMAVRFMAERHRPDVTALLGHFRAGDYPGYRNFMRQIGTRYDAEFAAWVREAGAGGRSARATE
jgi:microbial collagenase